MQRGTMPEKIPVSRLGNSDLTVSRIGFGGWQLGGDKWGPCGREQAACAVAAALQAGITLFDTAPAYGWGMSEALLGELLAPVRAQVVLSSKCGLFPGDDGRPRVHLGHDSILRECEASLRRLRSDYVDIYFIHWPDHHTALKESFAALNRLVSEGCVRRLGVCNFPPRDLERACRLTEHLTAVQYFYNPLTRGVEQSILPLCRQHSLALLPYGPLCQGLFGGHRPQEPVTLLPAQASNRHLTDHKRLERNLAWVDMLRTAAQEHGLSLPGLVIAWLVQRPGVASLLIGSSNPEHIRQNCRALHTKIPPALEKELESPSLPDLVSNWIHYFG